MFFFPHGIYRLGSLCLKDRVGRFSTRRAKTRRAMMRSVLLFVAVCGAHASLPWEVKNGMDQTRDMMIKAPAIAKEIFAQVIPGRGFRRGPISAEDCVAMKNMTSETLARMSNSTVECVDGLMSFAETLCTPACQKSEMFGKSSTSGRRLMGGDMESPSKACVDPCFSPLMSSFITLMKSRMAVLLWST